MEQTAAIKFCVKLKKQLLKRLKCLKVRTVKNIYREQVSEWHKRFKEAQKVRMQKSRVKTMLTAFFYAKGIIHHEYEPEKQTVNGKFYKEVIKRLIARVHCVRPEFQENGSWYLLHDNAPAHSSGVVSKILVK
jgi:hypothetical protein